MTTTPESSLAALLARTAASIDPAKLWFVSAFVPTAPNLQTEKKFDLLATRAWLTEAAGLWPAPLGVGTGECLVGPEGNAIFTSFDPSGRLPGHCCILGPDGRCAIAVQVGTLREETGGHIWAIGEGALTWLTVCYVQLAAGWARRYWATTEAIVELGFEVNRAGRSAPKLQIWNHSSGVNAAAAPPVTAIQSERRAVRLAIEPALPTQIALALLLPLLRQLGLEGSRQIRPDGRLIPDSFVGHANAIRRWADVTGLAVA